MSRLVFLAHLPGLRIGESSQFAGLALLKLPFEEYDRLTIGAFDSYEKDYRSTEPVFLAWEHPTELFRPQPDDGRPVAAIQMKRPFAPNRVLTEVGLEVMDHLFDYIDEMVYKVWVCLSLAHPGAALLAPKYSVTFVHCEGGCIEWRDDQLVDTIQLQGEADQEYLFSPELRSAPIDADGLRKAEEMAGLLEIIAGHEPLDSAVRALVYSQTPVLSPRDQLVLCVMALERLLLGDDPRSLRRRFAQGLAPFGGSETSPESLESVARALYDARSSFLHGGSARKAALHERRGDAAGLLAEVVVSLAERVKGEEDLGELLAATADGRYRSDDRRGWVAAEGPARPADRLNRHKESVVSSLTSTMGVREDKDRRFLWSPMIGLAIDAESLPLGSLRPHLVMPLSAGELSDLEDRDIRHDFLQAMEGYEALDPSLGRRRSVLLTVDSLLPEAEDEGLANELLLEVGHAVVALRLSGLHRFCDPVLLGKYFYRGSMRFRRATVLRQTVLKKHFEQPDRLTEDRCRAAGELADLLVLIHQRGAHESVRKVISLFRRSFQVDQVGVPVAATLAVAALEGVLGSFAAPPGRPPIEELVGSLLGEGSAWFRAEGRRFRNHVAHGRAGADDREPLEALWAVVARVLVELLRFNAGPGRDEARPTAAFRQSLADAEISTPADREEDSR